MHNKDHWAFHIKKIHEAVKKNTNSRLSSYNLTVAQIVVLMNLYDTAEKQMTMKEMEKVLGVAQSTAVGIMARLEEKGFVERFEAAYDKRIKFVRITSLGMEYCNKSEQYMYEEENAIISVLTEEEKVLFNQLLEKVSDNTR